MIEKISFPQKGRKIRTSLNTSTNFVITACQLAWSFSQRSFKALQFRNLVAAQISTDVPHRRHAALPTAATRLDHCYLVIEVVPSDTAELDVGGFDFGWLAAAVVAAGPAVAGAVEL